MAKWKNTIIYRAGDFADLLGKRWRCLRDNQASPPGQVRECWTRDLEPVLEPLIIGGACNSNAWYPSDLITGSKRTTHNMIDFQLTGFRKVDFGGDQEQADQAYRDATDAEIRQNFQNHINGEDLNGVPRSTYLNANTTGYILFDLENPRNFGAINLGGWDHPTVTDWFVEGLIRRIQIFREFCPNAQIGVWRFGSPDIIEVRDDFFGEMMEKFVYASNVEYNGQKFVDAIQFYHSGIFNYRGPGTNSYNRIISGGRVDQIMTFLERMEQEHNVIKPFIPMYQNDYQGNHQSIPNIGANCNDLNAIEMRLLTQRGQNHNVLWYPSWNELNLVHSVDVQQITEEIENLGGI